MKRRRKRPPRGQNGSSEDDRLRLEEQIEKRAYELWLAGGCRHGNDLGDWLQAERELLEQRGFVDERGRSAETRGFAKCMSTGVVDAGRQRPIHEQEASRA